MPDEALPAHAALTLAAEARRNVELQAQILTWIPDGVNIVSVADGRILYNNPAFETMFGYEPGELIGQTPDVLNAPEGGPPEATATEIIRSLEANGAWRGELLNRRKDDSTFWTHATITAQELPQVGRVWLSILRDITERKQMEMALWESQQEFTAIAICTPDIVLIQDASLRYTMIVNSQLGLSAKDIIGKTDFDFLARTDAEKLTAIKRQVLTTGQSIRMELPLISPSGGIEYFSGTYMPRLDTEGRPDGIIGYFENVTEKKATEAALAKSQLHYRALIEGSGMVTWSCTASGQHAEPQTDWMAFTGQTAEELSVMGWTKALHPDDLARAEACWGGAVTTGKPFCTEYRIRRHDGQWRWMSVHAVPIRNAAGEIEEWFGINMDITERKRAVQALSASEALLRTITENSPDEIFFLDRRLNIEYLNPASLEVVRRLLCQQNVCLKDVMGRPLWALLGENSMTQSFRQLDEQVITSGEISCVEDVIDMGGSTRTLLTLRAPIRDSGGNVVGLVGVARDITTRKHEEQERLASLEQQRDALVREVHHRIKNHLHGVLGLLRMEANVHPDLAPHLSEVSNQIKAIAGVYGLQCAVNGAGADLDRVVRLIVASAARPVAYQGLAGEPLVLGDGDAVPVALVVNELITNALKHRTVADPARPVRVTLERVGEDTLLTVRAGPARLPADFDYAARQGLGIGLELITTLLPSKGVNLAFFQDGDEVRAELRLDAPLFISH